MDREIELIGATSDIEIILKLDSVKTSYEYEHLLRSKNAVIGDDYYDIKLTGFEEDPLQIVVLVNDEEMESNYRLGLISFGATNIFSGVFGYVRISLHLFYKDYDEWLYSEYLPVLVKKTINNRAVNSMLDYIKENQSDILFKRMFGMKEDSRTTSEEIAPDEGGFLRQILLIEEVISTFKSVYGHFKTNSRYMLESVETVDKTEKLTYINDKTLQYLVSHPESLRINKSGIRHNKQNYLPDRTLMMQNRITQDIYENQAVIGFLQHVIIEVIELRKSITEILGDIYEIEPIDGYTLSAKIMYENALEQMYSFDKRINEALSELHSLFGTYQRMMNVHFREINRMPRQTAIFLTLPHYNRIYKCMLHWFENGRYMFGKERQMLGFVNDSNVYEIYVLTRLVEGIKNIGFTLIESKNVIYPKRDKWKYKNKEYNNTFTFDKDGNLLTLYYEPLIYDENRVEVNGISLYRNNTVSVSREDDEERKGHYYVPDYLIKYDDGTKARYVICDAKYSKIDVVRGRYIPDLSYKYLFSLSPIDYKSSVLSGLSILYGKPEQGSEGNTFYDRQIGDIRPFADIIPFSVNMNDEVLDKEIENMIEKLMM